MDSYSNTEAYERLLQLLSAQLIELNALQMIATPEEDSTLDIDTLRAGLHDLVQMTREALYVVRVTVEDLPAPELEDVTLAEALSRMVEETAERLGLSSRVSFSGADEQGRPNEHTLSSIAERMLLLIAREALYQVEGHAGARRLRLMLNYGQDEVTMSLEDDGVNTATQAAQSETAQEAGTPAPPLALAQTGIATRAGTQASTPIINDLRQRLERMGGALEIVATVEKGTHIQARIPYTSPQMARAYITSTPSSEPSTESTGGDEQGAPRISAGDEIVRLLIVDGQAVTRAGLHRLLESYAGLQVVGEAADGVQAVSETLELGPAVVLMDTQLPEGQSLEALRQIKELNLDTKVLLLATQDREEYLYETLRAGADGYVLKDIAPDELARAVRTVAQGEVVIQSQIAGRLLSRFGRQGRNTTRYNTLTTRELEVLRLLARGLRNKEIAARLYVSERTVNFHLANIYQKLNVSGRTEALSKALEQGLITP